MGAAENKELVRHIYSEVSRGNPQPLHEHMAADITWTIIGSTPLSGTFRGTREVTEKRPAGADQATHSGRMGTLWAELPMTGLGAATHTHRYHHQGGTVMPRFMDFHDGLKLPAAAIEQIARAGSTS
jgi:ketosteroid isomerase-like protein